MWDILTHWHGHGICYLYGKVFLTWLIIRIDAVGNIYLCITIVLRLFFSSHFDLICYFLNHFGSIEWKHLLSHQEYINKYRDESMIPNTLCSTTFQALLCGFSTFTYFHEKLWRWNCYANCFGGEGDWDAYILCYAAGRWSGHDSNGEFHAPISLPLTLSSTVK